MRDPRALANTRNLTSYRAWSQEGYNRSGFSGLFLVVVMSSPLFVYVTYFVERATRGDPAALIRDMLAALVVYVAAVLGTLLYGIRRLNAWKRAHPWAPPSA